VGDSFPHDWPLYVPAEKTTAIPTLVRLKRVAIKPVHCCRLLPFGRSAWCHCVCRRSAWAHRQPCTWVASGPGRECRQSRHKKATLKTYKGFPHGMPTTEAETLTPTCWQDESAA